MLTIQRRITIARRRIFAAAVLVTGSGLLAFWAGRSLGLSLPEEMATAGRLAGTVAASLSFWAAALRLLSPDRFYELFINDRYYLGEGGGSIMKPATFSAWLREGGDLVFDGPIYYNNTLIREAVPKSSESRRSHKTAAGRPGSPDAISGTETGSRSVSL
jgi:hypothetical protein